MKLIESKYEILPQETGLEGVYKQIERAGRLCYKSEDKISEGSAEKMVKFLSDRGHGSPLEHGTVYLHYQVPVSDNMHKYIELLGFYGGNPYSKYKLLTTGGVSNLFVTTNYRVLVEHNRLDDLEYLCEPGEYHERRYSVKFTCSRSISHEFVRHRVMSFCQESQRYCNYSLGKFSNEIVYIIPDWIKIKMNDLSESDFNLTSDLSVIKWRQSLQDSEQAYMYLTQIENIKPQDARSVLPNDCKTELMVTGFASDWEHFFKLRTATGAHPDARSLACPLEAEFKLNNYI